MGSLDGCRPLQQLTFGLTILFKPKLLFHSLIEAPFLENKSQAEPSAGLWRTQLVFSVSPPCVWRSTDGWGWHTWRQLEPQLSPGTHVGAFTSQQFPLLRSPLQKCCWHRKLPLLLLKQGFARNKQRNCQIQVLFVREGGLGQVSASSKGAQNTNFPFYSTFPRISCP